MAAHCGAIFARRRYDNRARCTAKRSDSSHAAMPRRFGFCTTRGQRRRQREREKRPVGFTVWHIFLRQLIELLAAAVSSFFIFYFFRFLYSFFSLVPTEIAVALCGVCVCVCTHCKLLLVVDKDQGRRLICVPAHFRVLPPPHSIHPIHPLATTATTGPGHQP